jgi:uncharacterized protein YhaN
VNFKRLTVGGFGRLAAGLVLEFGPGLNLIIAPNESGKTTCADLITGLFYGFGTRSQGVHAYEPWEGGETGGELTYHLSLHNQDFTLGRHLLRRGEKVTWRDASGRDLDTANLVPGEVHLGQTRGVFNTVSRIRLDDLQEAFGGENPREKNQTQNELLGFFFQEAATLGEVANPVQVRQSWQEAANALYSKDRRRGKQDQLLREALGQAESDLAQARLDEEQAAKCQAELEDITAQLAELKEQQTQAVRDRERAQRLLASAEIMARTQDLGREIAELTAKGLVDEETWQRSRDLNNQMKTLVDAYGAAQSQAKETQRQADELLDGRKVEDWAGDLEEATRLLAGLEVRKRDLDSRQEGLADQAQNICSPWGLSLSSMASMPGEVPAAIAQCQQEMAQAQGQATEAEELLGQSSKARPFLAGMWDWGLIIMLSGFSLSWFSGWSMDFGLWFWLGVGVVCLGACLAAIGRQAKTDLAYRRELENYQKAVLEHLAGIKERLSKTASGMQVDPMEIDTARLDHMRQEAGPLLKASEELSQALEEYQEQFARVARLVMAKQAVTLQDLSRALRSQKELQAKASHADEQARRMFAELKAQELEIKVHKAEYQALLEEAGVNDNIELQKAMQRAQRVKELAAKKEELENQLRQDSPGQEIPDLATARAKLEEMQTRYDRLEQESRSLAQERGRLEQSLRHLAQAMPSAQVEERLNGLLEQRRELARRHDTLALAGEILHQALDHYRMESQPNLLKQAGRYFETMTRGAYQWLGSDLFQARSNQPPLIMTQPAEGSAEHHAQALSRGTQDQLYLCLRLALADEIMNGGEAIPLILDDPLVNFDDGRMKAALALLAQVAQQRQVLLFTCHSEQAMMLKDLPHKKLTLAKDSLF